MRSKNWKLYLLGATAALALTTTACEPSGGDDKADGTKQPSATASQSADKPGGDEKPGDKPSDTRTGPGEDGAESGAGNGGSSGNGGSDGSGDKGKWDYADRQKPPSVSVCDAKKQDQYGKVRSVNMGGESPYPVLGVALGYYECGDMDPDFRTSSATGAASDLLVDSNHLKVVVGGQLASRLGTKTPDANKFLDEIARMQDNGELDGPKAPEFYIQHDAEDPESVPVGDDVHVIYLHQIIDGD